jgi:hypothetical protein
MHSSTVTFSRYLESAGVAGCVVKKGSATNGVTAITSVTDKPVGIIGQTKSASDILADGQIAVIVSGMTMALAGAAVVIDQDVVVDSTGKLVPKTVSGYVVGKAKTSAVAGEYFEILVNIRYEGSQPSPTILASSAVTKGKAVKVSNGAIVPIAATSDVPVGVAARTVSTSDIIAGTNELTVVTSGVAECLAGGNIAFGDALQVDADGKLVPKTASGYVVGNALKAAASGETFLATINIRKEPA